jgi:hypothetical protein
MATAERAKQVGEEEPDMATVHHRRVVTAPTPTWYLERQGSHNRKDTTCAARNMPYSLALIQRKRDLGQNLLIESVRKESLKLYLFNTLVVFTKVVFECLVDK